MNKNIFFIFLLGAMCVLSACDEGGENPTTTFDRKAMLENYAGNFIKPAFAASLESSQILQKTINQLVINQTDPNLAAAKAAWETAYLQYLEAQPFNFGPAGEEGLTKSLHEEIATFPVAESKMIGFINANDTSFSNFARDTRGFFAIEKMLYKDGLDSLKKSNYRNYLKACSNHLVQKIATVNTAWATYQTAFVAQNGTDVGSSTSIFYNEFLKSYELAKNYKLGLPLGKRIGQNSTEPNKVEALYSGKSLKFLKAHFGVIVNLWYANAANAPNSGVGLRKYIESTTGGAVLVTNTEAQIKAIKTEFDKLDENLILSETLQKDPAKFEPLFTEMQKMTRFFKSDLSSLIGIAITFSSGDGD
jgi:uncharacterized protein